MKNVLFVLACIAIGIVLAILGLSLKTWIMAEVIKAVF